MDEDSERRAEIKEKMEDLKMDDENVLRLENNETDKASRQKCLDDLTKIYPKFRMAIDKESADSR